MSRQRSSSFINATVQLYFLVILGIIGVTGLSWMTLTYVALLCVGVSEMTSGSAIAARMMAVIRK